MIAPVTSRKQSASRLKQQAKQQAAAKEYLTTSDAALIVGWTVNKVRALCEQGKLPATNTSTTARPRWTIRRCDLEAFLTPKAVVKSENRAKTRRRIDADVPKVFG